MIGLDTNLLIRYVTRDDPQQFRAASHVLEAVCTEETLGYVNLIVLVEMVWVLESAYGYSPAEIATVLDQLLNIGTLQTESPYLVANALEHYRSNRVDFADALIEQANRAAGCSTTFTFDRKAARLPGFELVRA